MVTDEPNEPSETIDVHDQLLNFIRENHELHRQALMYEPIWLEDLFISFKEACKSVKVKGDCLHSLSQQHCGQQLTPKQKQISK